MISMQSGTFVLKPHNNHIIRNVSCLSVTLHTRPPPTHPLARPAIEDMLLGGYRTAAALNLYKCDIQFYFFSKKVKSKRFSSYCSNVYLCMSMQVYALSNVMFSDLHESFRSIIIYQVVWQ